MRKPLLVARRMEWPLLRTHLSTQLRELARVLAWTHGAVVASLLVPIAAKLGAGIPVGDFTRDAARITRAPFYTGLFSTTGLLLWAAAATICFFVAALPAGRAGSHTAFWWYAGALTLVLLADDLLLLHDVVLRRHLHLPEAVLYVTYALLAAGFLLLFRDAILRTDFLLLALALGWFAASLAVDLFGHRRIVRGFYLLEDGFKLLGIVSWLAYFARTAYFALADAFGRGRGVAR